MGFASCYKADVQKVKPSNRAVCPVLASDNVHF